MAQVANPPRRLAPTLLEPADERGSSGRLGEVVDLLQLDLGIPEIGKLSTKPLKPAAIPGEIVMWIWCVPTVAPADETSGQHPQIVNVLGVGLVAALVQAAPKGGQVVGERFPQYARGGWGNSGPLRHREGLAAELRPRPREK